MRHHFESQAFRDQLLSGGYNRHQEDYDEDDFEEVDEDEFDHQIREDDPKEESSDRKEEL